jgi:ankyrin repeat protein
MANLEMAEVLLDAGIDIEKHNQKGETICMLSAPRCDVEYIEFLLDRDADLWRQDAKQRTALDHAEGALNVPVVQLLRARQEITPKRSSSVAAIPLEEPKKK